MARFITNGATPSQLLPSAISGRANAGSVSGAQPVVRLINGTNITVSLVEAGGELQFTINSAPAAGLQTAQWDWAYSNESGTKDSTIRPFAPKLLIFLSATSETSPAPVNTKASISIGICTETLQQRCITAQGAGGGTSVNENKFIYATNGIAGINNSANTSPGETQAFFTGGHNSKGINVVQIFVSNSVRINAPTAITNWGTMFSLG